MHISVVFEFVFFLHLVLWLFVSAAKYDAGIVCKFDLSLISFPYIMES